MSIIMMGVEPPVDAGTFLALVLFWVLAMGLVFLPLLALCWFWLTNGGRR